MQAIDKFLDRITMYRVTLYVLLAWLAAALIMSAFGLLPFSPLALAYSAVILTAISVLADRLTAHVIKSPANSESAYITALILALLIMPPLSSAYLAALPILAATALFAMLSKWLIAPNRKHIWNPAAAALVFSALVMGRSAAWWIADIHMLPFVIVGGLLIVRKIRQYGMPLTFLAAGAAGMLLSSVWKGAGTLSFSSVADIVYLIVTGTPAIFLASVMLTEPQTSPVSRPAKFAYGALTGILFVPGMHIGIFLTPELALAAGNILSWITGPKRRYIMTLESKKEICTDTDEFVFKPDHPVAFRAGQYLEWTIGHDKPDSRGNRRFFTISSSPRDPFIRMAVKFVWQGSSTFKLALMNLKPGERAVVNPPGGRFTLADRSSDKVCFLAGGIGITPFASMIRDSLDSQIQSSDSRDNNMRYSLIYSVKKASDIAYMDIWRKAAENIGLEAQFVISDEDNSSPNDLAMPHGWTARKGRLDAGMIRDIVPDFEDRTFYVSGPHSFVVAMERALKSLGVRRKMIRKDYFPGYV